MNPYLPSTDAERRRMLDHLGLSSVEDLLAQIPEALRWRADSDGLSASAKSAVPSEAGSSVVPGLLAQARTELEMLRDAQTRGDRNTTSAKRTAFLGAGSYRHFIPSVVASLATRAEFLTAYTPYQPEASQGILQATFEFQTAIARLTEMEVANAGLYDGATAVAEGVLMALNLKPNVAPRVVLSAGLHPQYRQVVRSHVEPLGVEVAEVKCPEGTTPVEAWKAALGGPGGSGVGVIQSPNFFGCLEDGLRLMADTRSTGALGCVVFNPVALGILATPGAWGADIAVAEGQPLGLAPCAGGESLGLFATRKEFMWKIPGRLVGLTRDRLERRAYVLTLQSREQHIRRARATSNICSNQALYALMAGIHMAALGPEGLREVASQCASRAAHARKRIAERAGLKPAFAAPAFHEFVLRVGCDAEEAVARIAREHNLLPGYPLGRDYPELRDCLLVCATELTTGEDIERLAEALASPGV